MLARWPTRPLRYEVADTASRRSRSTSPTRATRCPTSCCGELIDGARGRARRRRVRCVVLTSTHDRVFSAGANLGGFAADVPLVHKHFAHRALPAPVPADRRARQAVDLRGQRPRARGRARDRARVRPDHRARGGAVRDARDQRRRVPVHDHGADLPQRPAQEDQRAAAAGRADLGRGGGADRDRQPGRPGRRVRRACGASGRASSRRSRR